MRSRATFGWCITGVAVVVALTAALACGESTPPAKSASDKESAKTEAKTEDKTAAEDKSAEDKSGPGAEPTAEAPKEGACPIDNSQPATSKAGTVKVLTGCVSAQKSLKLLEQYYPQLHACFASEFKANRKAKGEVNIKINVGQSGTYSVRVHKDDVTSEELVKCLVGVLEPLPYPKPEFGGATIEFTTLLK